MFGIIFLCFKARGKLCQHLLVLLMLSPLLAAVLHSCLPPYSIFVSFSTTFVSLLHFLHDSFAFSFIFAPVSLGKTDSERMKVL